ncbi:hypothetical protein K438DRAFT_1768762 [Mycena galopus ATCC 62051]|nr:hypothetical protein K438DRAFT_1768762 [Mycena galopus ATCC 62051]
MGKSWRGPGRGLDEDSEKVGTNEHSRMFGGTHVMWINCHNVHQIFGHHNSDALVANNTSLHLDNEPSPRLTGQRAPRYGATTVFKTVGLQLVAREYIAVAVGSMIIGYLSALFWTVHALSASSYFLDFHSFLTAVIDGPELELVVQDMNISQSLRLCAYLVRQVFWSGTDCFCKLDVKTQQTRANSCTKLQTNYTGYTELQNKYSKLQTSYTGYGHTT